MLYLKNLIKKKAGWNSKHAQHMLRTIIIFPFEYNQKKKQKLIKIFSTNIIKTPRVNNLVKRRRISVKYVY